MRWLVQVLWILSLILQIAIDNLQESLGKTLFNEFGDVIDLFGDSRDSEEDIMDIMAKVREINDNAIEIA